MADPIDRSEGRRLFGLNPTGYDEVRPRYPDSVYEFLVQKDALRSNTATLEIGAGNGLATRKLIELGANPITIVEPDERFAPLLNAIAASTGARCEIVHRAFEDLEVTDERFDLVAAATAFHWVQPSVGISKVAQLLKPGGYAALWWNVLGDLDKEDRFHDATQTILRGLAVSPSGAPDTVPFALDRKARETDFAASGAFDDVQYFETRWSFVLDTDQVGKLYESFSHIQRLPAADRATLLRALMEVAANQFGGRVERNVTSPLYLFRRKT